MELQIGKVNIRITYNIPAQWFKVNVIYPIGQGRMEWIKVTVMPNREYPVTVTKQDYEIGDKYEEEVAKN